MTQLTLRTTRLDLRLDSTETVLARIEAMGPADRSQVSPEWVLRMRRTPPTPWTHGFTIVDRSTGAAIGSCAFKGPPDADGMVEIAYGVDPDRRGRGYAKEAARALVDFAREAGARVVRAHTLPENAASIRVLVACGFTRIGEVVDPDDGLVVRWELVASPRRASAT
jgi:RimJ/RimL family protein N-acetyltransferase